MRRLDLTADQIDTKILERSFTEPLADLAIYHYLYRQGYPFPHIVCSCIKNVIEHTWKKIQKKIYIAYPTTGRNIFSCKYI
jgi:hypothetical protein